MSKEIFDNNLDIEVEKKGKEIYRVNPHYRRLANIMEHPEFREFYDTYMKDPTTANTMLMFMKIYEAIENNSSLSLTPHQKLAIVKEVVENQDMRSKICAGLTDWDSKYKKLTFEPSSKSRNETS